MFQIFASLAKKILLGKIMEISLERALTYGKEHWLSLIVTDVIIFLVCI